MPALARVFSAATIVVVTATIASAQTPASGATTKFAGEVAGRVVNADTKAPVAIATIEVTTSKSTVAAARTSTRANGAFRAQGLRAGRYVIRIRALGFTARELPAIEIGPSSPSMDVGTVTLVASPVELQKLDVIAKRQEVELAPDRNTYVVRDMPTTRGGNALDVLRNVPAVDVDIDNVVSLRGNSGVVVQINGRPSPMKQPQLGNFLSQLPADMVDKVEVIPNPSARDDPTGVAGIINIVMRKETDAGTSGGLTLAGGTTGQANVGGNLGYQRGALSLYGSYGFMRDRRPRSDAIYRENRYLSPMTFLEESGSRLQLPLAHTLTGSGGYKLGQHDELSGDLVYSTRDQDDSYTIQYRNLNSARDLTGRSDRATNGTGTESNFESALAYKHSFATKGHRLSSEARIVRDAEGGPTSIASHTLSLDGVPVGASALERQESWEHPNEYSVKTDYVRPFSGHVRLETGYKAMLQRFHTTLDTRVLDTTLAVYRPDSSRISDFTYRQLINSAYGMLSAQRGKFQLQGGVRLERATTRFHLRTSDSSYDNPYSSMFPSALVAYNFDDSHQVKLSYSTRIRRPDEPDQLDPTRRYSDPLNVAQGNPYLKPEYIRSVELGLQRSEERMTLQLTPFFRRTLDAVRTIRTIDSVGVSTRTYANVSTSDAYGADATIALSGGKLGGFASASGYRQVSDAANVAPGLSTRTFGWRLRTNASYRVEHLRCADARVVSSGDEGRAGQQRQPDAGQPRRPPETDGRSVEPNAARGRSVQHVS